MWTRSSATELFGCAGDLHLGADDHEELAVRRELFLQEFVVEAASEVVVFAAVEHKEVVLVADALVVPEVRGRTLTR